LPSHWDKTAPPCREEEHENVRIGSRPDSRTPPPNHCLQHAPAIAQASPPSSSTTTAHRRRRRRDPRTPVVADLETRLPSAIRPGTTSDLRDHEVVVAIRRCREVSLALMRKIDRNITPERRSRRTDWNSGSLSARFSVTEYPLRPAQASRAAAPSCCS
jgi:hypothetical protein